MTSADEKIQTVGSATPEDKRARRRELNRMSMRRSRARVVAQLSEAQQAQKLREIFLADIRVIAREHFAECGEQKVESFLAKVLRLNDTLLQTVAPETRV